MLLDRDHITVASRIMLPTYVSLNVLAGFVLIADPTNTLQNARALRFQESVLPLAAWGYWLVLLAATILFCWLHFRHRMSASFGLAVSAVSWMVLCGTWAIAIKTDGATPLGPLFAAFVTVAHIASIASLVRGDKS